MSTAALILAAGKATRFGAVKQLIDVNGQPMIVHALAALADLPLCAAYVVLGANASVIKAQLPDWTIPILAPDWSQGMGRSLAQGIAQLPDDISHVLVTLCDLVEIEHADYQRLLATSRQHPQQIVACAYGQRCGVPAIFCREDFAALGRLDGDKGARDYLLQQKIRLHRVPLSRAYRDIDTQDDLKRWQQNRLRSGHDPLQTER